MKFMILVRYSNSVDIPYDFSKFESYVSEEVMSIGERFDVVLVMIADSCEAMQTLFASLEGLDTVIILSLAAAYDPSKEVGFVTAVPWPSAHDSQTRVAAHYVINDYDT